MLLPLLQHLQLRSQSEDSILGSILSLLGALPAKPTPHSRHLVRRVSKTDRIDADAVSGPEMPELLTIDLDVEVSRKLSPLG